MTKALENPALNIKVIDVREAFEYEIVKVDGVPLLPLGQINERFTELDPNQSYYIHCKAGGRSLKALNFLRQQGFKYLKRGNDSRISCGRGIDSMVTSN